MFFNNIKEQFLLHFPPFNVTSIETTKTKEFPMYTKTKTNYVKICLNMNPNFFFKSQKQEPKIWKTKLQMELYYDNIYENMNMKQNPN
jgi:hypothetical protein